MGCSFCDHTRLLSASCAGHLVGMRRKGAVSTQWCSAQYKLASSRLSTTNLPSGTATRSSAESTGGRYGLCNLQGRLRKGLMALVFGPALTGFCTCRCLRLSAGGSIVASIATSSTWLACSSKSPPMLCLAWPSSLALAGRVLHLSVVHQRASASPCLLPCACMLTVNEPGYLLKQPVWCRSRIIRGLMLPIMYVAVLSLTLCTYETLRVVSSLVQHDRLLPVCSSTSRCSSCTSGL